VADVRLAEMVAALSLATDLGMGQPMELAVSVAALGVALGRRLGLEAIDLSDIYYLALVKHIGCTSDSLEFARFSGGDDVAMRRRAMLWPSTPKPDLLSQIVRFTGSDQPPLRRARLVASMMRHGSERPRQIVAAHCEAGGRLVERLGLGDNIRRGLAEEQERWDGRGLPAGTAGEELSIAGRVVMVAHDALALHETGADVPATIAERAGHAYDPTIAGVFPSTWSDFSADQSADSWARGLAAEPDPLVMVPEQRVDDVALAIADFTDLKSPYLLGHSTRVAELATGAARILGVPDTEAVSLRRAALLHDVGRTGIPNGIWDKRGPLTTTELERVRMHTYYTERVLARTRPLASLAVVAGSHHENLDGSGYHRGVRGTGIDRIARLLRAADCLDALRTDRPHRPALSAQAVERELRNETDAGRLDPEAVAAVVEAASGTRLKLRVPRPAGLSEREVQVLRLLVHGLSNRDMGERLHLSAKTVGHHVQHIYNKVGVTSRAAAALFAMEADLV
jgi:HD-GYP domain-containing protein (c-di-GMP phosphodiesterase class II)